MKRQSRLKKIRLPNFVENLREQLFKKTLVVSVIILFFILASLLAKAFLYRSDYFRLRTVEMKNLATGHNLDSALSAELLKQYKDRNIFAVNINGISKTLQASYPYAYNIAVRRSMPDKLTIELNFRMPVALLADVRQYPVDMEGFAIPNLDPKLFKGLPIIKGINIRDDEKRGNRAIESKGLKIALDLLSEIKKSLTSPQYTVNAIDAGDANNLSFYLDNGALEIKIGCEDFRKRIYMLKRTLKDPRLILGKIKYIDLRFKDVVIGPK